MTANQEYQYWLGKRVMLNLRAYKEKRQAQREVIQQFQYRFSIQKMQQILLAIRVFANYSRDQKTADTAIIEKIQASIKQRFLKSWAHSYSKRVGLKLLATSLQNSQTRISFDQIRHVQLHQNAAVQYFRSTQPIRLVKCSF